jgi:2-keto-4-pentenoate hydratase/2-oxohepta-3-ene-1,7-dioic acid hydratase in catechol pathway
MKLLRVGEVGRERPALLDHTGQLRDLSEVVSDVGGTTLLPETMGRLAGLDTSGLPPIQSSPRIGACVANIGKIICVGLNYRDHAAEANMALPLEPILFLKAASAVVGPDDAVEIPRGSEKTDWEVELGVVIGKPGRYIAPERAMEHVAGYCVVNDISERSYQLERGGQWDKGKSCDTFAPLGPWLVTADELGDPQNLDLWLEVDGRRVQNGNTRDMVFGVAHLIAYISQFMSLQSGDVIATGTPAGVGLGRKPSQYLRAGQRMRVGIAGLGIQTQHMIAAR